MLSFQEHPRATQGQTQEEVARQIELFKQKIETFWNVYRRSPFFIAVTFYDTKYMS